MSTPVENLTVPPIENLTDRRGEGLELPTLVAIKAHLGWLAGRAVHPHIGDHIKPLLALLIKIPVMQEGAAIDEIPADVANRTLDFPFGLRTIGTTSPRREAPVPRRSAETRDCE